MDFNKITTLIENNRHLNELSSLPFMAMNNKLIYWFNFYIEQSEHFVDINVNSIFSVNYLYEIIEKKSDIKLHIPVTEIQQSEPKIEEREYLDKLKLIYDNYSDEEMKKLLSKTDDNSLLIVYEKVISKIFDEKDSIENTNSSKDSNEIFTSYVDMSLDDMKKLIEEKYQLLSDKIEGNITEQESENSGFLFWNCKMILRNIYMICDKIVNKFSNELSNDEIKNYSEKATIIKTDENVWKTFEDIKETYLKICSIDVKNYKIKYSQEDYRKFFYHTMSENEKNTLDKLNLNDKIKIILESSSSNFQIKYLEDVGYIFIGEKRLLLDGDNAQMQYVAEIFTSKEDAIKEIEDIYSKIEHNNI